jgi:hypothetical protein
MSGLKKLLMEYNEAEYQYHKDFHFIPVPTCKHCMSERQPSIEEQAMAVYDHSRSDELDSTERQEDDQDV